MICKISKRYNSGKTVMLFAAMAALFGALISAVSVLAVPPTAAFIALLLVFSYPEKRGSALCAVVSAGICVLAFFIGSIQLFSALTAVIIGLAIGIMYLLGRTKPEAVALTAVLIIALSFIALWAYSGSVSENYSISSMRAFYSEMYAEFKTAFLDAVRENYLNISEPAVVAEELEAFISELSLTLDNMLLLLPSLAVIAALIISGISFKIFGAFVYKYSDNPVRILKWRFLTSNVFAAAYVVLALMNIFLTGSGVFVIAAANIYSILNFVYAYVGFNFATALLAVRMRPSAARLVIILAVLMLSSFAVQVLAIGGVIFTFLCNKAGAFPDDKGVGGEQTNIRNESENDNEKQ